MELKVSHRLAKPAVFSRWNKFNLVLKHDSIGSSFNFDFYFDPENQEDAELFAVSHFHEAYVSHNGERLVSGFAINQRFKDGPKKSLSSIAGYSKTGVLEDCSIPIDIYPLQVNGLSLAQIAKKLCDPFRLKVVIDPAVAKEVNSVIKTTTLSENDNIKTVLTKLASQRKLIVTHNELGDLYFTKTKTNLPPLFDLIEGMPGTEMELVFDGQKLHSHITVIKEAGTDGGNAGQVTIRNPLVPVAYTYRPLTVTQSSGDENTIEEYAKQIMLEEIKNAIKLLVKTNTWTINGKLIRPNNVINVFNPNIYIYKKTKFFVEEVSFEGTESKQVTSFQCVLPCCYDGSDPVNPFVNAHENFPRYNYKLNANGRSIFSS